MKECPQNVDMEPYSFPHTKNELKSYFQDIIVLSEFDGKQNIVTLKTTVFKILYNWHQETSQKECDENKHITEAAAKFIK